MSRFREGYFGFSCEWVSCMATKIMIICSLSNSLQRHRRLISRHVGPSDRVAAVLQLHAPKGKQCSKATG